MTVGGAQCFLPAFHLFIIPVGLAELFGGEGEDGITCIDCITGHPGGEYDNDAEQVYGNVFGSGRPQLYEKEQHDGDDHEQSSVLATAGGSGVYAGQKGRRG